MAMARQLWLLRHADAEPHGTRADAERKLTERGLDQARVVGMALARMGAVFGAILVSPKARARETAELALAQMDESQRELLELHQLLADGLRAREALDLLTGVSADGPLLLVGHEPDLSSVASELAGGRVDLKKGGLVVVRLSGAGAQLVLVLRPAELALIAGVTVAGI
jgi:phosphohistidine phosphatase